MNLRRRGWSSAGVAALRLANKAREVRVHFGFAALSQLQRTQRPVPQEQAGSAVPARSGRHLRTHSRAARSLRSCEPPGQHDAKTRAVRLRCPDSGGPSTASMCWRSSLSSIVSSPTVGLGTHSKSKYPASLSTTRRNSSRVCAAGGRPASARGARCGTTPVRLAAEPWKSPPDREPSVEQPPRSCSPRSDEGRPR
jgi:hypothetical protein